VEWKRKKFHFCLFKRRVAPVNESNSIKLIHSTINDNHKNSNSNYDLQNTFNNFNNFNDKNEMKNELKNSMEMVRDPVHYVFYFVLIPVMEQLQFNPHFKYNQNIVLSMICVFIDCYITCISELHCLNLNLQKQLNFVLYF
jgi:hypothetical protein